MRISIRVAMGCMLLQLDDAIPRRMTNGERSGRVASRRGERRLASA
jgi:hypothetical protein